jgi:hypothetical protein
MRRLILRLPTQRVCERADKYSSQWAAFTATFGLN